MVPGDGTVSGSLTVTRFCLFHQVSNIVLNTSFLSLLTRLMRANVVSPAVMNQNRRYGHAQSAKHPSSSSPSTVSSNFLLGTKVLIATILGSMLRYATFISPPSGRKDDHIIPLLLSLLAAAGASAPAPCCSAWPGLSWPLVYLRPEGLK